VLRSTRRSGTSIDGEPRGRRSGGDRAHDDSADVGRWLDGADTLGLAANDVGGATGEAGASGRSKGNTLRTLLLQLLRALRSFSALRHPDLCPDRVAIGIGHDNDLLVSHSGSLQSEIPSCFFKHALRSTMEHMLLH
jgi:hypothetical protein